MFIGEYTHSIDSKRRLAVPASFRKELGKTAVITQGLDGALFLYPEKEWNKIAEKLSQLPISQSDARGFSRLMLAAAMKVELDKSGRILIPDYLTKAANLEKKVVLAGLYNRIEIWDKETWEEYKEKTSDEVGDMAERLKELVI